MSPEGAESDGSQPVDASLPFSLAFSSSSSSYASISAFVSASSSRSYLLKTFVDLTSPLRSVLLREFETIQSGSPYASNAHGVSQWVRRRTAQNAALAAGAGFSFGNSLAETVQPSSPYAMESGVGSRSGSAGARRAEARRSPPGRAPETP